MTPEEHVAWLNTPEGAAEVVAYHHPDGALQTAIAKTIRTFVAAEREACAALAQDWPGYTEGGVWPGEEIAAAIRERKD